MKDRKYILPLALSYLRKYGFKAFLKRVFITLQSGNIHSSYSTHQNIQIDTLTEFYQINPRVVLVSNDLRSPSHAYRIGNFSEALWELSVENYVLTVDQISKIPVLPRDTSVVIFWRTAISLEQLPWFENAKSRGVFLAYDNDDLTFDSSVYTIENVHALTVIPEETAAFLTKKVCISQEKQVKESHLGIACTPEMVTSYGKLGIPSLIVPIVIPRWMERQASEIRLVIDSQKEKKSSKQSDIKIVYASGSPSHGMDFQSCVSGITKFLSSFPNSTLTIIGSPPMLEKEFPINIRGQINYSPMVAHEKLMLTLSEFDVQIAPLESGNPFVEAKSATKFMQGGILGIPTIATPTLPFCHLIENGINGFLASTPLDWFQALSAMTYKTKRFEVGQNALKTVKEKCTVDFIKPLLAELILSKASSGEPVTPGLTKSKTLYWLVPDFSRNSGGTRNIFNMATLAQQSGFESKIIYNNSNLKLEKLRRLTNQYYGFGNLEIVAGIPVMESPHAVIAVHHSSVPWMKTFSPPDTNLVYLVQDFEPYFYPMSTTYIDTLSTYFDPDLQIITSLKWMSEKIYGLTGSRVPYLDFPMDREIYKVKSGSTRSGIIFYAKQDTPRRLYELGLKTLRIVNRVDSSIPISIFGGGELPSDLINAVNYSSSLSNQELANHYQTSKVGLSFAPTNPSGIPYEMMACGLPVVDVAVPGEAPNKYFNEKVVLSNPTASSLASEILNLLNDECYWGERSKSGLSFIQEMHSKDEIQEVLINFLENL
jgi:glycosyltransferase involved in cell wall biosynthesis